MQKFTFDVPQGNIICFYCVVGHICRFLHKSFEARVAGQRDFNQTTFVNIFYRQHIYVNVTVNLPLTQCIKEGVSVQRKESWIKTPEIWDANPQLLVFLASFWGHCSPYMVAMLQ